MCSSMSETARIGSSLTVDVPSGLRTYGFGPALKFMRIDHVARFGSNGLVAVCDLGCEFFFSRGCSMFDWAVFSAGDVMEALRIIFSQRPFDPLKVERFTAKLDLDMACAALF